MTRPGDADTRRLAAQSLARDDPTGWFDRLYVEASEGTAAVPWDRPNPTPLLVDWLGSRASEVAGRTAMVVGCGFGRDAEYVASLGCTTTAFDVSPTAVDEARARHPDSPVRYEVGDLLALSPSWTHAFDLVVESNNVQSMPPPWHGRAAAAVASLVAPGGTLLVLAARGAAGADGPPWPLTRDEIEAFAVDGVGLDSLEDPVTDDVPRWRAVFVR